jgi:hypothetical protein
MKKERRLILRTETFERVSLRQNSRLRISQMTERENYHVKVYRIETEGNQLIFECDILSSIDIETTNDEIRLIGRIQQTKNNRR